jgi:uncharacterized protein (DUF2062 family)/2-polyprenyl-3-methyl-5-hydroxy-6-metoxy-1,4-benzoquinol methylase
VTRRPPARWARLFQKLRTEGDTPARQAFAVALGLFIGCTPFYGFHLALSLALGTLFRLNRLKVYVAANISNPLVAPFLYASEIQLGGWLRRGTWYLPSNWSSISWWHLAGDVLLGAVVIGGVLGTVAGLGTYAVVNRRGLTREVAAILEGAATRFVDEGVAAWEFAHGKLRGDPVYLDVLRSGVLPRSGTIVDIGCGQGLMLSLILSARDACNRLQWPRDWPTPPLDATLIGVELRRRIAAQAQRALDGDATIISNDITNTPLPPCHAVLVFDVLHLIARTDQEAVLRAIYTALEPGGVLVLREADKEGGWRFTAVRIGNRITGWTHGKWRRSFHFRTADEWREALAAHGFAVDPPVAAGSAPFANVMLYARR